MMRKNVAGQHLAAQMNSRTDGAPLTTGVSVFVTVDNGTQTAGGGTATHKGNGHWDYAPTQAETNGAHVAFTFTHATGIHQTVQVYPVAYDPGNATSLGLGNLDAAVSSRLATAGYTAPDNAGIAAILDDTGTSGVQVADKAGYALSAAGVDAIHDEAVEGAVTLREMLRGFAAALMGKASGLATTTAVYRDLADTKARITATVDADGNRTAVTRDLT